MIFLGIFLAMTMAEAQSKSLNLNPSNDYIQPPPTKRIETGAIAVRERSIVVDGTTFRQIEYKGQFYLVRGRQSESYVDCQRVNLPTDTFAADAELKTSRYTRVFVESLRQSCDEKMHAISVSPDMHDMNLGISFKGSKPDSAEKKVFVNPLKKTGNFRTSF
jgi:uncharacterized protein YfaS (alpha-2-macroglobulin family)